MISIHAPREGSDGVLFDGIHKLLISIHAPREGSDAAGPADAGDHPDFYPRSPRGERRKPRRPNWPSG